MRGKHNASPKDAVWKKVLHRIGVYRWLLALSVVLAGVSTALTLWIPLLAGHAIDCVVARGTVDFVTLRGFLIRIVLSAAITAVLQWLMNTVNNQITFEVVQDIRREAFEKLQQLPLRYLDAHAYGEIVSRVISDADQFGDGSEVISPVDQEEIGLVRLAVDAALHRLKRVPIERGRAQEHGRGRPEGDAGVEGKVGPIIQEAGVLDLGLVTAVELDGEAGRPTVVETVTLPASMRRVHRN